MSLNTLAYANGVKNGESSLEDNGSVAYLGGVAYPGKPQSPSICGPSTLPFVASREPFDKVSNIF